MVVLSCPHQVSYGEQGDEPSAPHAKIWVPQPFSLLVGGEAGHWFARPVADSGFGASEVGGKETKPSSGLP